MERFIKIIVIDTLDNKQKQKIAKMNEQQSRVLLTSSTMHDFPLYSSYVTTLNENSRHWSGKAQTGPLWKYSTFVDAE